MMDGGDQVGVSPSILTNLNAETYVNGDKFHDVDSSANRPIREQFSPANDAAHVSAWAFVDELRERVSRFHKINMEKLPKLQEVVVECNQVNKAVLEKYDSDVKQADEQTKPLKAERKQLIVKRYEKDKLFRISSTLLETKESAIKKVETIKASLTTVKIDPLSLGEKILVWGIRAVLGVALALSLGLIIGALNQYKPFTWQLVIFWFVGSAVLFNSGTVVFWLANKASEVSEARRQQGSVCPRGNKWIWILVFTMIFFSASDAATLMFGAFRLLSVTGTAIPLSILFLVCFIFVFPYLFMEVSYGSREGERKVREHVNAITESNEKKSNGDTLDSMAKLRAEVAGQKADLDQIDAQIADIDAEIAMYEGRVIKPSFRSPLDNAPGVYVRRDGEVCPIHIYVPQAVPVSEDERQATNHYWKAVDAAENLTDQIMRETLGLKIMDNKIHE